MGDYKQGLLDGQAREAPRITGALIVTTILGAAGAAQFGFAIAALNSPEGVIEKDLGLPPNGFPFSMAVAATSIAAIVGANLAGTLADKLGRRLFLVLCNFMFLVGGALCVGSGLLKAQQSAAYALLLVARAIIGLGVGAASAGCPLYLGEIAPSHLKGAYGSVGQFSVTLFIVVAEVLGIWMSTPGLWYWMLGFHAALGALSLLTAPWLLESPRWLVARGRVDEARKILTAIRGYTSDDSADAEIAEIQEASSGGGGGNGGGSMSVLDVLRDPVYRRPTLVACVLQLAQQLSGINAVFFFSTSFFADAGISDAIVGTLLAGVVNVLATGLAMVLIDSKGRKPLLLVGSAGMALAGIALTVVLVVKGSNPAASGALGWVAIVLVLLYVMFFEIGLGSIPWLIGGELLPEAPRASGMAAAAGVNWIFTTVIALGFQPVKAALGAYCFLPFVGFLVATFLFALRFVPETKGRTPNELLAFFAPGGYAAVQEDREEGEEA